MTLTGREDLPRGSGRYFSRCHQLRDQKTAVADLTRSRSGHILVPLNNPLVIPEWYCSSCIGHPDDENMYSPDVCREQNTYILKMRALREWMRIPKKKGRKEETNGRLGSTTIVEGLLGGGECGG